MTAGPSRTFVARPNDVLGQQIIDYAKRHRLHPLSLIALGRAVVPKNGATDERRPDTDPIPRYRLRNLARLAQVY
jgi:hypothetical protein